MRWKGTFSGDYEQFFQDANRHGINQHTTAVMLTKIAEASEATPFFLFSDLVTHYNSLDKEKIKEQNKKLNVYLSVLDEVSTKFTDQQKQAFFLLCSQKAIPGGGV